MDRFPLIITGGGMLLGWIAGGMAVTDPALKDVIPLPGDLSIDMLKYSAGAAGALLVLAIGKGLAGRRRAAQAG
jgi:predicted tellurium resistance membrane protein TerC